MITIKAIRLAMPGRGLHNGMGFTIEPLPKHDKINYLCTLPKKKTDIKLNTLKCSYNRLLMTIDCPFLHGGATNECAGTTICMTSS